MKLPVNYVASFISVLSGVTATLWVPLLGTAHAGDRLIASDEFRPFVASQEGLFQIIYTDQDAWKSLVENDGTTLIRDFPLSTDVRIDLSVQRVNVFAPNARVVTGVRGAADRPLVFDANSVSMVRGHVSGAPNSPAMIIVSPDSTRGYIKHDGRRYRLSPHLVNGKRLPAGQFVITEELSEAGFIPPVPFCGVESAPDELIAPRGDETPALGMLTLEIAIDTDYEYFELFNDLDAAATYAAELYGAISDIYLRDVNTRVELTYVRLWDTPDDLYNESDPLFPFQSEWEANQDDVPRDVAQLLTGRRDLPYGGVAYLSSLCGGSAYSVAGFINGSIPQPVPLADPGNWDLIVTAHELGHNCGTGHTHDGYFPNIDQCGLGVLSRGTIMSYCHIEPGGIANIDMHMHRRVEAVMRNFIGGANCVIDDCNGNSVADAQDISDGASADLNTNGIPDECEDCNANGILDTTDIGKGDSQDIDNDDRPDECQADCNSNLIPDTFDIQTGAGDDEDGNNVPDECETDCDDDGIMDWVEINDTMSLDIDRTATLDSCQDCDNDGVLDSETLAGAHNLWVAGSGSSTLGQYHARSGVEALNSDAGFLNGAQDLIITEAGRMLVASSTDNRVVEFDVTTGAYVADFVTSGSGGLSSPTALAEKPDGGLLVSSRTTDSVLEYNGVDGSFIGTFVTPGLGGLSRPFDLVFGPNGNLYVSSGNTQQVIQYNGADGSLIGTFVSAGSGGLSGPRGLVFKPDGNLLVAGFNSNAILEYEGATGAFIRQFNESGQSSGYWSLEKPRALRIGPNGQVYAAASQSFAQIQMFDVASGKFLRAFYVIEEDGVSSPSGFDFVPGNSVDCNLNLLPDTCDIASGDSADTNANTIPDECETDVTPCDGDANADGQIDPLDAGYVQARLGCLVGTGDPACDAADVNEDSVVDPLDVGYVLARFGDCS